MIENGSPVGAGKRRRHITAFYIETLILVAVFILVILVLTKVFAWSGRLGERAEILTGAVHLAENAAEAAAASESLEDLRALLDENGNAGISEDGSRETGGILQAWYDGTGNPAPEGDFRVEVSWRPAGDLAESGGGEGLVECTVSVFWTEEAEPVYVLETAVYVR